MTGNRPFLYLAGPIKSDPLGNVRRAVFEAEWLSKFYFVDFFVPHLSCLEEIILPRQYEEWLAYDFNVIRHCDGLYRMTGISEGADREVEFARSIHKPVFLNPDALESWRETYE